MLGYNECAVRELNNHIDVDSYGKCGKPCKPNCFS